MGKSDSVQGQIRLTILLRRQVIQRVGRALFIEEKDVVINFALKRLLASYMQVHRSMYKVSS